MKKRVLLLMEIYEGLIVQNVKENTRSKDSMNMLKNPNFTNVQKLAAKESLNQKSCFMERVFLKASIHLWEKLKKQTCALLLAQHWQLIHLVCFQQ